MYSRHLRSLLMIATVVPTSVVLAQAQTVSDETTTLRRCLVASCTS